jgi:hypothetical protein
VQFPKIFRLLDENLNFLLLVLRNEIITLQGGQSKVAMGFVIAVII